MPAQLTLVTTGTDYQPAPPEVAREHLRRILEVIGGSDISQLERSERPTRCDVATRRHYATCADCDKETTVRYRVGRFGVCLTCANRRLNAAPVRRAA